jgi:hypothetical protein
LSSTLRRSAGTAVLALAASVLSLPFAAPAKAVASSQYRFFIQDIDGDDTYGLYKRALIGGDTTPLIADDTVNSTVDIIDLSVSRDGSRVIFVQDTYSVDGEPLREKVIVRDVSGRHVRVLLDLPLSGNNFALLPALSPDGLTAVWTQIDFSTGNASVRRTGVSGGTPAVVVNGYGGATYLSDSKLFVQDELGNAYTVPFPDDIEGLAVAPSGARVTWSVPTGATTNAVQTASWDGTTASEVKTLEGTMINTEPSFSQDSATVYFVHEGDIWSAPADASAPSAQDSSTQEERDVVVTWTDDGAAPGALTAKPALLLGTTIKPQWTLPGDTDLSGVLLRRKLGSVVQRSEFVVAPQNYFLDSKKVGVPDIILGQTYTYELTPFDRSGHGGPLLTLQATALGAQPMFTDPTSTGSSREPFKVTFAATAPSDATYVAQYLLSGTSTWKNWVNGATGRVRTFGAPATTNVLATTSTPGKTYLFRVTVKDAYGNASPAVTSGRAVVPFDQTRATFVGGTNVSSSSSYLGGLRKLWTTAQYAKVSVTGNRFQIVGLRCAGCGKLAVYEAGKLIGTIDSYASTTKVRQVLFTKTYSSIGTHSYVIKPLATPGRPNVLLDGFATRT